MFPKGFFAPVYFKSTYWPPVTGTVPPIDTDSFPYPILFR